MEVAEPNLQLPVFREQAPEYPSLTVKAILKMRINISSSKFTSILKTNVLSERTLYRFVDSHGMRKGGDMSCTSQDIRQTCTDTKLKE